jgi:hypothetical protein
MGCKEEDDGHLLVLDSQEIGDGRLRVTVLDEHNNLATGEMRELEPDEPAAPGARRMVSCDSDPSGALLHEKESMCRRGPSRVTSRAYRNNYDGIFGKMSGYGRDGTASEPLN